MNPPTQATSPQTVKKMEKEIVKEGKAEEIRIQHAMKDLSTTEKAHTKAHKAVQKAETNITKMEKKELAATAAVQKATHKHDIAATHLHTAERDRDAKKQQDIKLQQELDAKKASIETAINEQKRHSQGREAKINELHGHSAIGMSEGAEHRAGATSAAGLTGYRADGYNEPTSGIHENTYAGAGPGIGAEAGPGPSTQSHAGTGTQTSGVTGSGLATHHYGQDNGPGTFEGNRGYYVDHTREEPGYSNTRDEGIHGLGAIGHGADASVGDTRSSGPATHIGQPVGGNVGNSGEPRGGIAHMGAAGTTAAGAGAYTGEHTIVTEGSDSGFTRSAEGRTSDTGSGVAAGAGVYAGDRAVRGGEQYGKDIGFPSGGPGGNVGSLHGRSGYGGEQVNRNQGDDTGYQSGWVSRGENSFRDDRPLGKSGTGADPGFGTAGTRDMGRSGNRELIGARAPDIGKAMDPGHRLDQNPGEKTIHRGTGIGGEEPRYCRDRIPVGRGNDSGTHGLMSASQAFGEDLNMPGGYGPGAPAEHY